MSILLHDENKNYKIPDFHGAAWWRLRRLHGCNWMTFVNIRLKGYPYIDCIISLVNSTAIREQFNSLCLHKDDQNLVE